MAAYEDNRTGRWRYRVWVTLPSGKRERLTGTPATDTRKAAEHAERLHVLRVMNPGLVVVPEVIEAPAPPRKEVPTLAEFAEAFLREQTGAVKPSARDALKSLVGLLVEALGAKRLDEIDQPTVNRYIASMRKLARGTVNNRLAALSSILEYAGPNGAGHVGTCELMLHVKNDERNTPITAVPGDDVAKLIATCTSKRDRVAVLLATEAGLRIGEILGVQWTDIKDGCVTVRRQIDGRANVTKPKHDVVRTVPLSPALVSALGALPRRWDLDRVQARWCVAHVPGHPLHAGRAVRTRGRHDPGDRCRDPSAVALVAALLRHDVRGTWCSDAGASAAHGAQGHHDDDDLRGCSRASEAGSDCARVRIHDPKGNGWATVGRVVCN